jgi:transcriptional regulator of acetoin/glycerol metabolism
MKAKEDSYKFITPYEQEYLKSDPHMKYEQNRGEWIKFINGEALTDSSIIPPEILESWNRCKGMNVDPYGTVIDKVLSGKKLTALLEKNREFIEISRPFMKNLYSFVAGSGSLVTLFDHEAYLLETMGDDNLLVQHAQKANFVVGACLSEKTAGTNGAGIILERRSPIQIYGAQHYRRFYHKTSDSSAPIYDPTGAFIGVIVISGPYFIANPHTLGMAVAAAQAIGNILASKRAYEEIQISNSYLKAVLSSISEALIAVDKRGCISLINDKAKGMFPQLGEAPVGQDSKSIFGDHNEDLRRLIELKNNLTDAEVKIWSEGKYSDYILTCTPINPDRGKEIGKVLAVSEIKRANNLVNRIIGAKANFEFGDICGKNKRFLDLVRQAKMVARNNSNILLLGKSGTGKDVFAQAIHNESQRKKAPFMAINCAAIPRDLISSELFGYTEGAFTGSRRGGSRGKFELADGGTIFLDEIAEIPLELQAVLLRVIEDRSVTRLGGAEARPIDVRIIAATNKNLEEEVRKGNFREDLYYRLNVFTMNMVPLKERLDDISLLVTFFVNKYGPNFGKKIKTIDPRIFEYFSKYSWPGNIRELQNVIERMLNLAVSDHLSADLIPTNIFRTDMFSELQQIDSSRDAESQLISKMLQMNLPKKEIARKLKIGRTTLYRRLDRYNLS